MGHSGEFWQNAAPWKERYVKPRHHIKKQRHHFADKDQYSQSYGFSSSHICMWKLNYKEGWVLKNWFFWIVVLEKTRESLLDCKQIKPVSPQGNQPWIFIGRTDAEAGAPILWPPDVESWLIGKDPDAGKDWRQKVFLTLRPNSCLLHLLQCRQILTTEPPENSKKDHRVQLWRHKSF